jgi:hypothetical protein
MLFLIDPGYRIGTKFAPLNFGCCYENYGQQLKLPIKKYARLLGEAFMRHLVPGNRVVMSDQNGTSCLFEKRIGEKTSVIQILVFPG